MARHEVGNFVRSPVRAVPLVLALQAVAVDQHRARDPACLHPRGEIFKEGNTVGDLYDGALLGDGEESIDDGGVCHGTLLLSEKPSTPDRKSTRLNSSH